MQHFLGLLQVLAKRGQGLVGEVFCPLLLAVLAFVQELGNVRLVILDHITRVRPVKGRSGQFGQAIVVESEIILVVCFDEVALLVDVGAAFAFDWAATELAATKASKPNAAAHVTILIIIVPPRRRRSGANQVRWILFDD